MSYSTLTANENLVIADHGDLITESNYDDFTEAFESICLDEMQLHLEQALYLEHNTTNSVAILDNIATVHNIELANALTYLMLYHYYFRYPGEQGTVNYDRKKDSEKKYNEYRNRFPSMALRQVTGFRTIPILR